jgi:ketosteroid isomerase-like protein
MSQENVEIVRHYYEAVERGFRAYWEDPRSAEDSVNAGDIGPEGVEMARYLHPNAEWKTALTGVTYRGYVGMAKGFDEIVDAARDYRVTLKKVRDLGGDQVLVELESAMKGSASDIEVKAKIFALVAVGAGLITRMQEYLERDDALEAAGLSE